MAYLVSKAITDVRRVLNDDTQDVWTDDDIIAYINEAILVIKNTIPEYFDTLDEIENASDSIDIANVYKNLIVLFAISRCFDQDEQDYRATKSMNEFEAKRVEMEDKILSSDEYATKTESKESETVKDVYFEKRVDFEDIM